MGRKRIVKTHADPKKEKVRSDWEANNQNISDALVRIALKTKKVPTNSEIAKELGISAKTVKRHYNSGELDEIKKKFRCFTPTILLKLSVKAMKMDNDRLVKLFFEVVEDLGAKKQIDVTSGGQAITPMNISVIDNETKAQLDKLK